MVSRPSYSAGVCQIETLSLCDKASVHGSLTMRSTAMAVMHSLMLMDGGTPSTSRIGNRYRSVFSENAPNESLGVPQTGVCCGISAGKGREKTIN